MTIPGKSNLHMDDQAGEIRQQGFTLMEVLIAMTILSVGLLAIASMQISSIQTTGGAKFISTGITWAEDRMEYLSSLDYSATPELDAGVDKADPLTSPRGYTITYTVSADNPRANCKLITVNVQWSERGTVKSTSLTNVKPEF